MIRFYGLDKPAAVGGRSVCWRENDAGDYIDLADGKPVAFDWGTTQASPVASAIPRRGATELAKILCIFCLDCEPTPRRAMLVYMRFRQRYVDRFPANWSVTDLDVRNAIEQIEAEGEAARREIDRAPQERTPPMVTDAGGPMPSGGVIVWDTDRDGKQIVPRDPDDFAWQPAPHRTDRSG